MKGDYINKIVYLFEYNLVIDLIYIYSIQHF